MPIRNKRLAPSLTCNIEPGSPHSTWASVRLGFHLGSPTPGCVTWSESFLSGPQFPPLWKGGEDTEERPCEDRRGDWRDAVISQEIPGATTSWKGQGGVLPSSSEGAWPRHTSVPDPGLGTCEMLCFSSFKSPSLWLFVAAALGYRYTIGNFIYFLFYFLFYLFLCSFPMLVPKGSAS